MKKLITLLKNELIQNKLLFLQTPLAIASVIIFSMLCFVIAAWVKASPQITDIFGSIATNNHVKHDFLKSSFFSLSAIFISFSWVVNFIYCLKCLLNKKVTGNSWNIILSKIITSLFTIPACFLTCIIINHLAIMLISTIYALSLGVNGISFLWSPTSYLNGIFITTSILILQGAALFPLLSFCILSSSFGTRLHVLLTFVPLVFFIIIEFTFLKHRVVFDFIFQAITLSINFWDFMYQRLNGIHSMLGTSYSATAQLITGFIVGITCLVLAALKHSGRQKIK